MNNFDKAVIKYLKAKGSPENVFVELVNMIGHGNGQYVIDLCKALGCQSDMMKASIKIIKESA